MNQLTDIRTLSETELSTQLQALGQPAFRAKQIYQWLWQKRVLDVDAMSNVGKTLRQQLKDHYSFKDTAIASTQRSNDGTIKYAFRVSSGHMVEGVLIPTPKRITACISSQAGCSLNCRFCATGYLDFKYNLPHYHIYDQVFILAQEAMREFNRPLTNIVYMGMGEPLLNYKNMMQSIDMICSPAGMGISSRRITVSSAGISKMIKKLGDDEVKFEFALSLHAAINEKRSQIMSINDSNNLESLEEALRYFYERTNTRVTYEYCVFKDFNDSVEDAQALVEFSRKIPSKVNIIEYNPVEESQLVNTSQNRMRAFIEYLEKNKVIVNVRRSRGRDIDGACGQLALRKTSQTS